MEPVGDLCAEASMSGVHTTKDLFGWHPLHSNKDGSHNSSNPAAASSNESDSGKEVVRKLNFGHSKTSDKSCQSLPEKPENLPAALEQASVTPSLSTVGLRKGSPTSVMTPTGFGNLAISPVQEHVSFSSSINPAGSIAHFQVKMEEIISPRCQELENKRLYMHQKRVKLEQRLHDFVGQEKRIKQGWSPSKELNTSSPMHKPIGSASPFKNGDELVSKFVWVDPRNKLIAYTYSGPLNKNKQPNGEGLMEFSDGQVYRGKVVKGYREGLGKNTWPDGQVYVGDWVNHSRSGRGVHTWPDGRKVTGDWKKGHLHGRVSFRWPNGASYDGECRTGKKHGRGIHTWANGKMYNGQYLNGKEHGFGTLTGDGWKYRGNFARGARHGCGIQIWKNKTYDGEWCKNKASGRGRIVWVSGATYTGDLCEGKYHGLGVFIWPSGKRYVGSWQNGYKHGPGAYMWPSGKTFDGNYKDGLKHGYGRMVWIDGSMYCGGWKNGVRWGRGIQTEADGKILHCGLWKNDVPYLATNDSESLVVLPPQQLYSSEPSSSEEDIVIDEAELVAAADDLRSPAPNKDVSERVDSTLPSFSKSLPTPTKEKIEPIPNTPNLSPIEHAKETSANPLIILSKVPRIQI